MLGHTCSGSVTVTATRALWRSCSNSATQVFSSRCSSTLASSTLTCTWTGARTPSAPNAQPAIQCHPLRSWIQMPQGKVTHPLTAHLPSGRGAPINQALKHLQGRLPAVHVLRCSQGCAEPKQASVSLSADSSMPRVSK